MKGKLVLFSLLLCALQAAYGQDKELKLVYEAYYPEVPAFVSSVSDELVREALLTGYREARGEYTVRLCHQKYLCEHTYTNGNMEDGNCPRRSTSTSPTAPASISAMWRARSVW